MTTSMSPFMPWVVIVIVLALFQFIFFGAAVGWARARYQIRAPATTGNEVFERYFRVQMNTVEQLLVFIPAIWLFAALVSAKWAAVLGVVYLAGRLIYFFSYVKDPRSRSLGFALSSLPGILMLLGVLVVAIVRLLPQTSS
jgi:glutathione S-transferase